MSNSPLVSYTRLSPNHSGLRKQKIDTITPHCVVGHLSLQSLGNVFASPIRQASSNYGIDDKGLVGMYVEEQNRSWCTSSNANDQRAVTIEIASDISDPYKITDAAMNGLIALCGDICLRNDIPKLLWRADKTLIGKTHLQNITVHRWFAAKACPGDYIFNNLDLIAKEVNKLLNKQNINYSNEVYTNIKPSLPYTVKINADGLNYRSGPGTNYAVKGMVRRNEVYTIVEESLGKGASKWGKLKSGVGWISLDYIL